MNHSIFWMIDQILTSPWWMLYFLVMCYASLLIHEMGHVLAGFWVGMRFIFLFAGPLIIQQSRQGLKFKFTFNPSVLMRGIACMVPTNTQRLRWRMAIYTTGGAIINLACAMICFGVLLIPNIPFHDVGRIALVVTGSASIMMSIVTFTPYRFSQGMSDGARFIALLRKETASVRWCTLFALMGASISGQRPRDWNPDLLQRALIPMDNSSDFTLGANFSYYHALDIGDVEQAQGWLDNILTSFAETHTVDGFGFDLEVAYFAARYQHNPQKARVLFAKLENNILIEPISRLRVEAAILLAEHRWSEAFVKASEAISQLPHTLNLGLAEAEKDWIEDVLRQLKHQHNFA